MTQRKYSREMWQRIRGLFISGCSLRDIARQTRIPLGTICARAAREKWKNERNGVIETKDKIAAGGHDPHADAVAAVVLENKIATLIAQSRSERLLAEKALAAVEGVPIESLEQIQAAQAFRANLWPAWGISPEQQATGQTKIILHFHHERPMKRQNRAHELPGNENCNCSHAVCYGSRTGRRLQNDRR